MGTYGHQIFTLSIDYSTAALHKKAPFFPLRCFRYFSKKFWCQNTPVTYINLRCPQTGQVTGLAFQLLNTHLNIGMFLARRSPLPGTAFLLPVLIELRVTQNGHAATLVHECDCCTPIQPLFVFLRSC